MNGIYRMAPLSHGTQTNAQQTGSHRTVGSSNVQQPIRSQATPMARQPPEQQKGRDTMRPKPTLPQPKGPHHFIMSQSKPVRHDTMTIRSLCIFIVCVNYSDKLRFILQPFQKQPSIQKIFVVTSADDIETAIACQDLAQSLPIVCHTFDFQHQGAAFDKGCALAHIQTLGHLEAHDAYLILDADILVPNEFFDCLRTFPWSTNSLYGAKWRDIYDSYPNLVRKAHISRDITKTFFPGYFQLYTRGIMPVYPHSDHAGSCDVSFFKLWPKDHTHVLPISVSHLGIIGRHWSGIQGIDFDWASYQCKRSAACAMVLDFQAVTTQDDCKNALLVAQCLLRQLPSCELWAFVSRTSPIAFAHTLRRFRTIQLFMDKPIFDTMKHDTKVQIFFVVPFTTGLERHVEYIQNIVTKKQQGAHQQDTCKVFGILKTSLADHETLDSCFETSVQHEPST